jgi:hypothetical protein
MEETDKKENIDEKQDNKEEPPKAKTLGIILIYFIPYDRKDEMIEGIKNIFGYYDISEGHLNLDSFYKNKELFGIVPFSSDN